MINFSLYVTSTLVPLPPSMCITRSSLASGVGSFEAEEVRHPSALRHYFYIPRPRSHTKLYIEYDFDYMKGARRRTDGRTSSGFEVTIYYMVSYNISTLRNHDNVVFSLKN